ncbi:hypothetical protein BMF94_3752 [Rhodotorula taiwanensis]|uniref:Alpha-1,3-mannosyltransferase CMT1 n=1 Tax=Rhodotorula taiwanensis TaxID=741276 RepID=A0A2S5B9G8_9BASI|nr:hypothetical protein BMF94_3752 [Rhodotorula taiwanensis]
MAADGPLPTTAPPIDADSEPLLAAAGVPTSPSSPSIRSTWAAATGSIKRHWPRKRLVRLIAAGAAAVFLAGLVVASIRHHAHATALRRVRLAQRLEGFSESRLVDVPERLRVEHALPYDDLLGDPLLANHKTAPCRLNTYQQDRYHALIHDRRYKKRTYLVAINLFDSGDVAPALIRALYSVVSSLGPDRFHISIYENGSKDDTPLQLYLFAKVLRQLGAGFTINSDPDRQAGWVEGKRIVGLAELRNVVMQPMYDAPPGTFDAVIFINDVHLCEAEILEILLQHERQRADMSCGMDFKELRIKEFHPDYPLLFYDTWVARDMQGLPFYEIKYPKGDWNLPSRVLPLSESRFRYDSLVPFQVYSCFNGLTVMDASLFHPPHNLRFRTSLDGTDTHSECYLLCSDIWKTFAPTLPDGTANPASRRKKSGETIEGARIQVVPRAAVGYSMLEYERARGETNTTAFELEGQERRAYEELERVDWDLFPPKLVTTYAYGRWDEQASLWPSSLLKLRGLTPPCNSQIMVPPFGSA